MLLSELLGNALGEVHISREWSSLQLSFEFKDKTRIATLIAERVSDELEHIRKSAGAAHHGATHDDAVAKNKYDTHGLELSYLAGSQYARAQQLAQELSSFKKQTLVPYQDHKPIGLMDLITISGPKGTRRHLLLSKYCAGIDIEYDAKKIVVISPDSPLGVELIDCWRGDTITAGPNGSQLFVITEII